jgi:hypothetical protein
MPDDWESEAVSGVLAACRNRALARGDAGLGRSRARAGVGIAETIDDMVALFAVLDGDGGKVRAGMGRKGQAC